jgi:quinol monooxygenase YgiN
MSVLVQMSVKVSDTARFIATAERYAPMMREMGAADGGVYEDQNDPGMVTLMSTWQSHDAMHAASEKYGDAFNAEAGTEGLEWITNIWERKGDA